MGIFCIPWLSLWERWLSEARTERVTKALSVAFGDSSPRGRAKGKGSLDEALSEGKLRGPSGGVSCEHFNYQI